MGLWDSHMCMHGYVNHCKSSSGTCLMGDIGWPKLATLCCVCDGTIKIIRGLACLLPLGFLAICMWVTWLDAPEIKAGESKACRCTCRHAADIRIALLQVCVIHYIILWLYFIYTYLDPGSMYIFWSRPKKERETKNTTQAETQPKI